jgi:molecular chaperone GrpE
MSNEETKNESSQNEEIENSEVQAEEQSELELLKAKNSELAEKYARVHADFENIKKRLEREKYQAVEYANEKFAKDLVPVVDSLSMAIEAAKGDAAPEELIEKLKEGIELTMKQFLTTLEKHGITQVAHDEDFDPNIHNAVQKVDSEEHESGAIVQTFQTGYRYKGRSLRDAMVVIAN